MSITARAEAQQTLAERADDLAIGGLGEGLERACPDIAEHADLEIKLTGLVMLDVAFFEANHNDPALVAFLRDHAAEDDAWKARVEKGHADMRAALVRLEEALARQPWLSGEDFGLADISWLVNANRLAQAGYDLEPYPRLRAWLEKVAARPACDRALSWRPE